MKHIASKNSLTRVSVAAFLKHLRSIEQDPPFLYSTVLARLRSGSRTTIDDLVQEAYEDDAAGGPLGARECVHKAIFRLRRRGYSIVRNGHCYDLTE